ncbi:hypothetical protein KI387_001793, partial [Taxus chinensis]
RFHFHFLLCIYFAPLFMPIKPPPCPHLFGEIKETKRLHKISPSDLRRDSIPRPVMRYSRICRTGGSSDDGPQ